MRTSLVALAGSLLLWACVSGTRVVYVPVPVSDSAGTAQAPVIPPPAPPVVAVAPPPVAGTIVRAGGNRLLVSLGRPSYQRLSNAPNVANDPNVPNVANDPNAPNAPNDPNGMIDPYGSS